MAKFELHSDLTQTYAGCLNKRNEAIFYKPIEPRLLFARRSDLHSRMNWFQKRKLHSLAMIVDQSI